MRPFLKETDSLTISEFADLFGFPASAIVEAVERNRQAIRKPYYSIPDLAARWCMSRASVYKILREHEARIVDFSGNTKAKGKKIIYADVVDRIEKQRTRLMGIAA
jgi:predicted DNA-binding protein YlxM (UPF0122 family)